MTLGFCSQYNRQLQIIVNNFFFKVICVGGVLAAAYGRNL
jgi:hypothetical protein